MAKNILYAQSGGVTAVINATACGVIETAKKYPETFGHIYAGENGIVGVLEENLLDAGAESVEIIRGLMHTPAGAFGSCRYKLKSIESHRKEYERLIDVFKAHDIGYFFYNGGGDSQDTAHKVSQLAETMGYPLQCIGIPKTIDNDLAYTDNSPGFGSVAKYVATSIREASMDVASMAATSTKVFVMEVMGRHTGWIAAATGLAQKDANDAPHIILFPEIPFNEAAFLALVEKSVKTVGYCSICVSEGIRNENGELLSYSSTSDAFGHKQLGGVAAQIAGLIQSKLGYKYHWALLDYLQRSARHLASQTDLEQAYALGKEAVLLAKAGKNALMPIVKRISDSPYEWTIDSVELEKVANIEKPLPMDFIREDGFGITEKARIYLEPLIQGEAYPPFKNGLPDYVRLAKHPVAKKLPPFGA